MSLAIRPTLFSKFSMIDLVSFQQSKKLELRDFTVYSRVIPWDWFCVGCCELDQKLDGCFN